jgi:hypothetical protein
MLGRSEGCQSLQAACVDGQTSFTRRTLKHCLSMETETITNLTPSDLLVPPPVLSPEAGAFAHASLGTRTPQAESRRSQAAGGTKATAAR